MATLVARHIDNYRLQSVMNSFEKALGDKVRSLRRAKIPEMSIEALAELVGVTRQTITEVELGKKPMLPIVTIIRIARALGVKYEDLVGNSHELVSMVAEDKAEYRVDDLKRRAREHKHKLSSEAKVVGGSKGKKRSA